MRRFHKSGIARANSKTAGDALHGVSVPAPNVAFAL